MSRNLNELILSFAGLKVLVIGDAILDGYLQGATTHLCREAPVPIVAIDACDYVPGGAANTAVNLCSLGADVTLAAVVGDDVEGHLLLEAFHRHHIGVEHVFRCPARRTLIKQRIIAESQMVVRVDQGSTDPISGDTEQQLITRLESLFPASQAVVISDYGYGLLTPAVVETLRRLQSRTPRTVVIDSRHRLPVYRELGATAVKPNYPEALELLGLEEPGDHHDRVQLIAAQGERILELTGARIAAVTLDSDGALVFECGAAPYRIPAHAVENPRTAGAGDTFISALTLSLAAGGSATEAAEIAAAAAAMVVMKQGTSFCSAAELQETFSFEGKLVVDPRRLAARAELYRQECRRIVFTNGCFDILHRGHITYLNHAKALGDVLIVGVNSDESVRRLKGPDRPVNNLEDRLEVLSALSCVDHVVPFDDDTPLELIRAIRPDLFVKGGDYTRETLPEAAAVEKLGGRVEILPYLEDRSTTRMIQRVRGAG